MVWINIAEEWERAKCFHFFIACSHNWFYYRGRLCSPRETETEEWNDSQGKHAKHRKEERKRTRQVPDQTQPPSEVCWPAPMSYCTPRELRPSNRATDLERRRIYSFFNTTGEKFVEYKTDVSQREEIAEGSSVILLQPRSACPAHVSPCPYSSPTHTLVCSRLLIFTIFIILNQRYLLVDDNQHWCLYLSIKKNVQVTHIRTSIYKPLEAASCSSVCALHQHSYSFCGCFISSSVSYYKGSQGLFFHPGTRLMLREH